MVEGKEKIAIFDYGFLHHPFFDYLTSDEKNLIQRDIDNKETFIAGVKYGDALTFCTIFDICSDSLHVREVAGNFGRRCGDIYRISIFAAKIAGKNKITVCTKRRAVKKWAEELGFKSNGFENELEKAI